MQTTIPATMMMAVSISSAVISRSFLVSIRLGRVSLGLIGAYLRRIRGKDSRRPVLPSASVRIPRILPRKRRPLLLPHIGAVLLGLVSFWFTFLLLPLNCGYTATRSRRAVVYPQGVR